MHQLLYAAPSQLARIISGFFTIGTGVAILEPDSVLYTFLSRNKGSRLHWCRLQGVTHDWTLATVRVWPRPSTSLSARRSPRSTFTNHNDETYHSIETSDYLVLRTKRPQSIAAYVREMIITHNLRYRILRVPYTQSRRRVAADNA
jgi:hypothetical protein